MMVQGLEDLGSFAGGGGESTHLYYDSNISLALRPRKARKSIHTKDWSSGMYHAFLQDWERHNRREQVESNLLGAEKTQSRPDAGVRNLA
jgi:hypothetical protein